MALQWRMENTHAWYGFSGKFVAGWIVKTSDSDIVVGKWHWRAEIPSKYLCVCEGDCASLALARRASNRAWRKFLLHADLQSSRPKDTT